MIAPTKMLNDIASAYNNYESGRLNRARRKILKATIDNDDILPNISQVNKNKLIVFIEYFYSWEYKKIAAATRFARKYVKKIVIRKKKQKQ